MTQSSGNDDKARREAQNAKAAAQAAALPTDCPVCQRKGTPILLLRYAVLPNSHRRDAYPLMGPKERCNHIKLQHHFYVARMLRTGYVYALVQLKESPEIKIWQAYEVTPKGALRQFDPDIMPVLPPKELDELKCTANNDDVPGCFINLDEEKYSDAWIAFSDIPWDRETLSYYEQDDADLRRFCHVNIESFNRSPSLHPQGLSIDGAVRKFLQEVPEFNAYPDAIDSFSGFYSKRHKEEPFALFVCHSKSYDARMGALILEDTLGITSELNYYRQTIAEKKSKYITQEDVFHKHAISEMITTYRDKLKEAALSVSEAQTVLEVDTSLPMADGMPAMIPKRITKEEAAQRAFDVQWNRLLARYNEKQRAEDEETYQYRVRDYDSQIQKISQDYALWLDFVRNDVIWKREFRDVKMECSKSERLAHRERLAAVGCNLLEGGASDDATDKIWIDMLTPSDDIAQQYIYNVLFSYNSDALSALNKNEQANTIAKTLFTTPLLNYESMTLLEYYHARLMLSVNGALARNHQKLFASYPKIERSLQLYSLYMTGKMSVELQGLMTVEQYMSHLKSMTNSGMASVIETMKATSTDGKTKFTSMDSLERHLRIHDSEAAQRLINGYLRLYGEPTQITASLDALGLGNKVAVQAGQPNLKISGMSASLFPDFTIGQGMLTDETLELLKRNLSEELRAPGAFPTSSGVDIPKLPLLFSVISLAFMYSSLQSSLDKIDFEIGMEKTEAYYKLVSSTIGAMGNVAEVVGWIVHRWSKLLGVGFVKFGGVLVSFSAVIDGINNVRKAFVFWREGDDSAGTLYFLSSICLIVGGGLSALVLLPGVALFGVAGLAFALIIIGIGLALAGDYARSTLAEIWFDRCVYGYHRRYEEAWDKEDLVTLSKASSAFTLLVLGVQAETSLSFDWNIFDRQEFLLAMRLPLFTPEVRINKDGVAVKSAYRYRVDFFDRQGALYCQYQGSELLPGGSPGDGTNKISYDEVRWEMRYEPLGQIENGVLVYTLRFKVDTSRVRSYRVVFDYWPDMADKEGVAHIEIDQEGDK